MAGLPERETLICLELVLGTDIQQVLMPSTKFGLELEYSTSSSPQMNSQSLIAFTSYNWGEQSKNGLESITTY
jgi:hypothetical protein